MIYLYEEKVLQVSYS